MIDPPPNAPNLHNCPYPSHPNNGLAGQSRTTKHDYSENFPKFSRYGRGNTNTEWLLVEHARCPCRRRVHAVNISRSVSSSDCPPPLIPIHGGRCNPGSRARQPLHHTPVKTAPTYSDKIDLELRWHVFRIELFQKGYKTYLEFVPQGFGEILLAIRVDSFLQ